MPLYEIKEDGKVILEVHSVFGIKEAKTILFILHAFGRHGCSLWLGKECIIGEEQQRKAG